MPVSVLVVDDHRYVRETLALLIGLDSRFVLAGMASHGREAVELARQACPDAIVCDLEMPVMSGVEAVPLLRDLCHETAIVMYSADPAAASATIAEGADAVVDKVSGATSLLDEVERLYRARGLP